MSHDTHSSHTADKRSIASFRSAFWLIIILAGLFVAAVNFVKVESSETEEGHGTAATEHVEATSSETMKGETGAGKPAEGTHEGSPAIVPAADSAHSEHH
jgi:hypothetical protein